MFSDSTAYPCAKMEKLPDDCREHLDKALETDDPSEKDFHIRQVMQVCGVDHLPDESSAE